MTHAPRLGRQLAHLNQAPVEGEDDPRICVLRVDPASGEYWDNRHGAALTSLKMLFGALTAQRVDEGVHGKLTL